MACAASSIGFFVNPDTATLWRGGMATSALKQLIADADWGELDYFILTRLLGPVIST